MKTITLTAPEGYEFTGGLRYPLADEYWLCSDGSAEYGSYPYCRYILRKLPPPVLHLSDLRPGELFHLVGNSREGAPYRMLKHHPDDTAYLYYFHCTTDLTLFHRNDDAEVVRA